MSALDQIRLNEKRIAANVSQAIIGDVGLKLTIEGASELMMSLSDPDGRFRRSRFMTEATVVGLGSRRFILTKTGKQGANVSLTAEDQIINRLRNRKGPKKAFREKITRAQFVKRLVKEAAPDAVFVCPELRTKQPIAKPDKKPGSSTKVTRKGGNGRGIPRNASGLTVKGIPATATQKRVANEVLDAAYTYDPPRRAVVALLCAATQESVMGTVGMTPQTITDHDSVGLLQARLMYVSAKNAMSIPYNVRRFFKRPWTGYPDGAIKQANAGRSITDICASIQGMRADLAGEYVKWKDEAIRWIEAYHGGGGGSVIRTTTTTRTKKYAFEVKKGEDYWTAIKRLAGEVGWRAFTVGNRFYYIAEPDLFQLRRRVRIEKNTRGIDDIDFDLDGRKKAATASLTARANAWKAAPGTVVTLGGHWGPASGRWLVSTIDAFLGKDDVSVELKRPAKPKKEPAPETVTRTRSKTRQLPGGSTGGAQGAAKAVKWAKKQVGVTEGSAKYNQWMSKVGGSDPWCGYFIGYMMKYVCGFQHLPTNNGAHSSSWLTWSKASRVSVSNLKPGDIVVYDWGNGGETDHVALYIGGGRRIGGNESDQVADSPADLGRCVGAVRPRYR